MATDRYSDQLGIEQRLSRLEDERDICDLLYRVSHAIDYGLVDEFLDCYTDDGAFEGRHTGVQIFRWEGRETLLKFISHHTKPPDAYHKHMIADSRIAIDGDSAVVDSYQIRINAQDERPDLVAFGRYIDRVVRGSDNRWRILERVAEVDAFDGSKQPGTWTKF